MTVFYMFKKLKKCLNIRDIKYVRKTQIKLLEIKTIMPEIKIKRVLGHIRD